MYPLRIFVGGFSVKVSLDIAAVSEHFLCNNHNATYMQLIPLQLVQSNRVYEKQGKHTSLKEVKPLNLRVLNELFMFRPFVHLQLLITTFRAVTFPHISKFLHF